MPMIRPSSIAPNLTFLYINVGVIYRHLEAFTTRPWNISPKRSTATRQLGIEDPIPYVAIGKVYTQLGEFFIASLNAKRALQIDPYSADLYGQLGMVYFKARNYESAIPALKCAVQGCDVQASCEVRDCDPDKDPPIDIKGIPLEANDQTIVVYYYTYGSVLAGMYRPVGKTSGYCAGCRGRAGRGAPEVQQRPDDHEHRQRQRRNLRFLQCFQNIALISGSLSPASPPILRSLTPAYPHFLVSYPQVRPRLSTV